MIQRIMDIARAICAIMHKMDIDTCESVVREMEALLHSIRHYDI